MASVSGKSTDFRAVIFLAFYRDLGSGSKEYSLLFREAKYLFRFLDHFQFSPTSANTKFDCDSFHFYTYHMLHSEFNSLVYSPLLFQSKLLIRNLVPFGERINSSELEASRPESSHTVSSSSTFRIFGITHFVSCISVLFFVSYFDASNKAD